MINKIEEILETIIKENIIKITFSNLRKNDLLAKKIDIRKINLKGETFFQIETIKENKAFHKNIDRNEFINFLMKNAYFYKQWYVLTDKKTYHIKISKKDKIFCKTTENKEKMDISLDHNREKKYFLKEGNPIDFLVYLNIMNKEGNILKSKRKKFKQLNHYLSFIESSIDCFDKDREINIVDFGCGKSYLTFALAYYLKTMKYNNVSIIGLDLKEDVIDKCNKIANELKYNNLKFLKGDIKDYSSKTKIDMVISLHACNTATDFAIYKALCWNAKLMLMVPCCQHEINEQMDKNMFPILLEHGIIKEKFSALLTDAIRAEIIKCCGYESKIIEFIDMEHTPKNLLIKALLKSDNKVCFNKSERLDKLIKNYELEPTLLKLIEENGLC